MVQPTAVKSGLKLFIASHYFAENGKSISMCTHYVPNYVHKGMHMGHFRFDGDTGEKALRYLSGCC